MLRSLFTCFLIYLAYLSTTAAQSCDTTGTYETCCPSFDQKVLTRQGKEYRVHCNSAIFPEIDFADKPADCIKACSDTASCVDALWLPSNGGSCEMKLLKNHTTSPSVALVLIDSSGSTKEAHCDAKCPDKLGECENKIKSCDQSCPQKLQDCVTAKGKLCACPTPPPRPTCANGSKEVFSHHTFRFRCNQVFTGKPNGAYRVLDAKTCARTCVLWSCTWAMWNPKKRWCHIFRDKWDTSKSKTDRSFDGMVLHRLD